MDRRLFLTGLLAAVGTAGIATVLPRQAEALAAVQPGGPAPESDTLIPELGEPSGEVDEGVELAHIGRHRRWRRVCRRYWHKGRWRRRCHRRPFWIWLSI
jgi:hypothetical protein